MTDASENRSPVRRVLLWMGLAIGLAVLLWFAWLLSIIATMVNGQPGDPGDFGSRMVELSRSVQPGVSEGDAWTPLVEAMVAVERVADDVLVEWQDDADPSSDTYRDVRVAFAALGDFDAFVRSAEPESEADRLTLATSRDLAMEALARLDRDDAWARLDAALGAGAHVPLWADEHLIDVVIHPELQASRTVARALAGQMALASVSGDGDAYVRDAERLARIAGAIELRPTLVSRLVGAAIRQLLHRRIHDDLRRGELDAETCNALLRLLAQLGGPPDAAFTLEGERLFAQSIVRMTHTDDGDGDGRLLRHAFDGINRWNATVASSPPPNWRNAIGVISPTKRQTLDRLDEAYDLMIERAGMTRAERALDPLDLDAWVEALGPRYEIVATVLPASGVAISTLEAEVAIVSATRAMLAIEVHRALTGAPPERLADLVPGVLDAEPIDPFGKEQRFVYRKAPAAPLGYTLYSIAADGVDNLGQTHFDVGDLDGFREHRVPCDVIFAGGPGLGEPVPNGGERE
ncbi:MAG: hypothetical protein AAGK04_02505 [Planctomycetota bacterium]